MVAPVLEEIAVENRERLTVVKLDVDANPNTARDAGGPRRHPLDRTGGRARDWWSGARRPGAE
ncbi:thioredoxin family protein [Nonomuraea sp. SYSU D8015]|uniref:thioredoxin family protein n=1 Tax=Nonomuraea sp. SYSU D8015 TaxID=2593644 RepID=UPI00300C1572